MQDTLGLFGGDAEEAAPSRSLASVAEQPFHYPATSFLDGKSGVWLDRKREWIATGIKSEVGRDVVVYATVDKEYWPKFGTETSVFDPVLCELAYTWYCPVGGQIVDPFAGGSVRGLVAGALGRRYWGCDLRREQIDANNAQSDLIAQQSGVLSTDAITPVQAFDGWWAKREDVAGFTTIDQPSGAKVRAFGRMIDASPAGVPLVIGCSADSLMQCYLAAAAKASGRQATVFVPARKLKSSETVWAEQNGAQVVGVAHGYPSVYRNKAREWAAENGGAVRWIPAVSTEDTAAQVANLPNGVVRIVVPCGSGAIGAGVIAGLAKAGRTDVRVLLVAVSGRADMDEIITLARKCEPSLPLPVVELVKAPGEYADKVVASLPDGTVLDPAYAAKAFAYVEAGDLLWISGRRGGLPFVAPTQPSGLVCWVCGDSAVKLADAPAADFIFSCPPYGDLEEYSDDPDDLSNMEWDDFLVAYRDIIAKSVALLRDDSFACFVVGDFRDKAGYYRNFVAATTAAFEAAGAVLCNDAVLATPIGTAAFRVTRQFSAGRKMAKVHQNILVFCKGNAEIAAKKVIASAT